jgi:hypothetical protein
MPRPTNRDDLLTAAEAGFETIMSHVAALTPEQRDATFAFEDRDRNLRDVLMHLVCWHEMMIRWYIEGMVGEQPAMPAPGYTWRNTAALNQALWEDAQVTSLDEALTLFGASYRGLMAIIERHSDEELFTKQHYAWTGSTCLGSYLVSATSSHYDWAMKKLRRAERATRS